MSMHSVILTDKTELHLIKDGWTLWVNSLTGLLPFPLSMFGFDFDVDVMTLDGMINLFRGLACLLFAMILPLLQLFVVKKDNLATQIFVTFVLIHNVLYFFAIVALSGHMVPRYLFSVVFYNALIAVNYCANHIFDKVNVKAAVMVVLTTICLIGNGYTFLETCQDWYDNLVGKQQVQLELRKHNLKYGYASYWNAGVNTVYSNMKVQVTPIFLEQIVENKWSLTDHNWLSNADWYRPDYFEGKTFLLLSSTVAVPGGKESEITMAQNSGALTAFGEPVETFTIPQFHTVKELKEMQKNGMLVGISPEDKKAVIPQQYYVCYVYDYNIAREFEESSHSGDKEKIYKLGFLAR